MSSQSTMKPAVPKLHPWDAKALTLNDVFGQMGWQPSLDGGWTKSAEMGRAELVPAADQGIYPSFVYRAGAVTRTTPGRHLAANHQLSGPAKFVVLPGRSDPICRCDLPVTDAESVDHSDRELQDPRHYWAWASSIDQLAEKTPADEPEEVDIQGCLDHLKLHGWNAECGPDGLIVHVERRGLYRQIALACDGGAGWRLGADLIGLSSAAPRCRRAAVRLAAVANRRLPLARFSIAGTGATSQLRCEVHFGRELISNDWLLAATEAVEAGVVLSVRELQATVYDAGLAELVMAAPAA